MVIDDPLPLKPSLVMSWNPPAKEKPRVFMQRSLGVHTQFTALPMADSSWPGSQVAAVKKRLGTAVPSANPLKMRRFRSFVRIWLRKHLTPLHTRVSFEEWIAHAPYPEHRREELRRVWEGCCGVLGTKHYKLNSFVKTETYGSYKYPRAINSRHDVFKCFTGPLFHAIEQALFQDPHFVKFVPVAERPRFIRDRLGDWKHYIATDYSSFEALFTPELLRSCELQLYSYMGSLCYKDVVAVLHSALPGWNKMKFSAVTAMVKGVRMSGDMCTSLGNGFTNLMVMLFICQERGINVDGVVEGDDGLFGTDEVPPVEDFTDMGLKIKLAAHSDVGLAGFCKQYFDKDVCQNVVDPVELLCKFGWTHSNKRCGKRKVLQGLLRAKAFSLRSLMPSAPVAASLWRYALRITSGVEPDFEGELGWYKAMGLDESVDAPPVDYRSRVVVERVFNYPIGMQIAVEEWLDSQMVAQPIPHRFVGGFLGSPDVENYYWAYCHPK